MKKLFLIGIFISFTVIAFLIYKNYINKIDSSKFFQDEIKRTTKTTNPESIVVLATGLEIPWSLSFLPTGEILFTERAGKLKLLSNEKISIVAEIPDVKAYGEGGLMGLALHPDFKSNNLIYLYLTYDGVENNTKNRVISYNYKNGTISERKIIVDDIPGALYHNGGNIKFGPDKYLYITTGDSQEPSLAQNNDSLAGKILRVTDNGSPAPGNPFKNKVYSYGHRNPQGITWDENETLFETEHGPSGLWPNCCQDEINKIKSGENYGWPNFFGDRNQNGITSPLLHSGREIWAPAGLAYYKGKLYFGGLRGNSLYEFDINSKELKTYFKNQFGRIREVVLGPDRMLYISTSNRDGRGNPTAEDDRIIKIDPNQL